MKKNFLEELRILFDNHTVPILRFAIVRGIEQSDVTGVLLFQVELLGLGETRVARCSWPSTGPNAGIYHVPAVEDIVILAMVEGSEDGNYIIGRLSSKDDPMPARAWNQEEKRTALVVKAREMEELQLTGQRIDLTQGDELGSENLVLGQQYKLLLTDILDHMKALIEAHNGLVSEFNSHTHMYVDNHDGGPTNATTQAPGSQGMDFTGMTDDLKGRLDDTLSLVGYTEKGAQEEEE